jgi:excisionase family DNA binding protein
MVILAPGEHIDIMLPDGRIMVVGADGRTAVTAQAQNAEPLLATQDFTIKQACVILQISRSKMYDLLSSKNGEPVLASRMVLGRGRLIRREDLKRLIDDSRVCLR